MIQPQPADQAPAQSVTDLIAAKFGVPPEPEETAAPVEEQADAEPNEDGEQSEAVSEPEEVEVEFDGKAFRVPKELAPAVMKGADYTQKTQALAEQRRQIEHQAKMLDDARWQREVEAAIAPKRQQMEQIDNYLAQLRNVNVADLDMESGFKHMIQVQQAREYREQLDREITTEESKAQHEARERIATRQREARELLSKQIPEYEKRATALREYVTQHGYTETDFANMELEPRAMQLIHKAAAWDALQANKSAAVQKASSAPLSVKPGASNSMPQQVKDKLAFNKAMKSAKTSQEKARLIEQRLAGRF